MDFTDALELLINFPGSKLSRTGWNAAGQYVSAQFPDDNSKMTAPYLYLKNARGELVPWVPSQGDLFANDWEAAN